MSIFTPGLKRVANVFHSVILFSLRAATAYSPTGPTLTSLATYMQVDFGLGYIGMASDVVNLLRCVLVNSTFGSDTYHQSPEVESKTWSRRHEPDYVELPAGTPDHPRRRFIFRRYCDITALCFLSAIVPGVLGNTKYYASIDNTENARMVARLRYVPTRSLLLPMLNPRQLCKQCCCIVSLFDCHSRDDLCTLPSTRQPESRRYSDNDGLPCCTFLRSFPDSLLIKSISSPLLGCIAS